MSNVCVIHCYSLVYKCVIHFIHVSLKEGKVVISSYFSHNDMKKEQRIILSMYYSACYSLVQVCYSSYSRLTERKKKNKTFLYYPHTYIMRNKKHEKRVKKMKTSE